MKKERIKLKSLFISLFVIFVSFLTLNVRADSITKFKTGLEVNNGIRALAGCDPLFIDNEYEGHSCYNVHSFERATSLPNDIEMTDENVFSVSGSKYPIYAWYKNNHVYWYSEDTKVYLNENSARMFRHYDYMDYIDLRDLDSSLVTTTEEMFAEDFALKNIYFGNFDTSNVTSMKAMFLSNMALTSIDLSSFDTRKVTDFTYMFDYCISLEELDLSTFETGGSNLDISHMFWENESLKKIKATELFAPARGTSIFENDTQLVGGAGTTYDSEPYNNSEYDDSKYAKIDGGTESPGYFTEVALNKIYFYDDNTLLLTQKKLPGKTADQPTNPSKSGYEFKGWYTDKTYQTAFDFSNPITANETYIYAKYEAKEATFDKGEVVNAKMKKIAGNTSIVTSGESSNYADIPADNTIEYIVRANALPDDISEFTVDNNVAAAGSAPIFIWFDNETKTIYWYAEKQKVYMNEWAASMYSKLKALKTIDFTGIDTSRTTLMGSMFAGSSSLTTLSFPGWDTSNVYLMAAMFQDCTSLKSVDLSSFSSRSLATLYGTFRDCSNLETINFGDMTMYNVTDMGYTFYGCSKLKKLDLSNWNINVSNLEYTFTGCENLERIYATENFRYSGNPDDSEQASRFVQTFGACAKLTGGNGTKYITAGNSRGDYARLDVEGTPGYFTLKEYATVTFISEGETVGTAQVVKGETINSEDVITPTKEGEYTFKAWYFDETFETQFFPATSVINNDINLYAKFIDNPTIKVTVDSNAATVTVTGDEGRNILTTGRAKVGEILTITVTPKEYYVFDKVDMIYTPTGELMDSVITQSFQWIAVDMEIKPVLHEIPKVIVGDGSEIHGTVTVTDTNNNPITGGHVEAGTTVVVNVTANENYRFVKLIVRDKEGNETEVSNLPYNYVVNDDVTFIPVIEELPVVTIPAHGGDNHGTISVVDSSSNTVNTGDHLSIGTTITISVTPDEGYRLDSVSIKDSNDSVLTTLTEEPYTYEVNSSITVSPVYTKLPEITLPDDSDPDSHGTVSIVDPGTGNPITGGHVEPGTTITIDVEPDPDYEVIKVTVTPETGDPIVIDGKDLPYDLVVTGDIDIDVEYREKPTVTIPEGVTVTDTNGEAINTGDHVPTGTEITINVSEVEGKKVESVEIVDPEGNVIATLTEEPYTYEVVGPVTINPVYSDLPKITTPDDNDSDSHGTVSLTDPVTGNPITGGYVEPGTTITIDVEPDPNYEVDHVTVTPENGEPIIIDGIDLPYDLVVTGDIDIDVEYREKPTVTIPQNGVTVKDSNGNQINTGDHVPTGEELTIEVAPVDGYKVDGVEIKDKDGNVIATLKEEPYTYEVVSPITIEPIYTELPKITTPDGSDPDSHGTVSLTDPSTGNPITGGHVEPGTTITIDVKPDSGYEVDHVTITPENGDPIVIDGKDLPYNLVVTGDVTINPTYREQPTVTIPDNGENTHGTVTVTDKDGNEIKNGDHIPTGTEITVDVKPEDGYKVEGVEIKDKDGKVIATLTDEPYTYEVNGPITINPIIVEDKVEITLPKETTEGKVTIKDSEGKEITDGKIKPGEEITIDVEPKDGYVVDKVIIKDKDGNILEEIPGSELPKKYKVNGPITIEAIYKKFEYEIISGDNQTYVKGSKKDIVIKANGDLNKINGIEIDNGNVIDPSNYELESGSTILTLKSSFLEESSVGKHTITFNYNDGSVDATLNIEKASSPKTGDNIMLYVMMFILSTMVLITAIFFTKKRLSN